MVEYVIAHRQDLLGGRLIPILNGLRLANKTGARFLMTWVQGDDPFMSLVSGLSDILSGPFLSPATDRGGYQIGLDDRRLASAKREVEILPCPSNVDAGIGDSFVYPDLGAPSLCLDRRFSLYRAEDSETFECVKSELSRVFRDLPKNPVIEDAIGDLGEKMSSGRFAALHARRLHLLTDTEMTINRLDSYHTTDTFEIVGRHLISNFDALLVASDSGDFVRTMQERFGDKAIAIADLLDMTRYTGIQRAFLDMVFLSYAQDIYGALSAYGVVASVIGDGRFHNIGRFAAERDLVGGDRTHSIALRRAETNRSVLQFAKHHTVLAGSSALGNRIAAALLREGDALTALMLAAKALAMRFCEYGHATRYSDWGHYVHVCRASASALPLAEGTASRAELLTALDVLEQQIGGAKKRVEATLGDMVMVHLALASSVVEADNADRDLAPKLYEEAIQQAEASHINPRGLYIRLAIILYNQGSWQKAVLASEAAVNADPNYCDAWFHYARSLAAGGRNEDAMQAARRAVELEPEKAGYWFFLSERLNAMGNSTEAEECRQRATLIEPENRRYQAGEPPGLQRGLSLPSASA
jgi:tetratricopeptide (TPR) repeat protein